MRHACIVGFVKSPIEFGIGQNVSGLYMELANLETFDKITVQDISQCTRGKTKWYGNRSFTHFNTCTSQWEDEMNSKHFTQQENTQFFFCVTLDQFPFLVLDFTDDFCRALSHGNQKHVLYTPWELSNVSTRIQNAYVHLVKRLRNKWSFEIWCPSTFSQQVWLSLRQNGLLQLDSKVVPVFPNQFFEFLERPFLKKNNEPKKTIGFCFDFCSDVERKNCFGSLDAFILFTRNHLDNIEYKFVLKTCNFAKMSKANQMLFTKIFNEKQNACLAKIEWIDKDWPRNVFMEWLENLWVFISLHRSEGFGFVLTEAMALGVVCIATNYGGNTDYMNSDNSLLIDFSLCNIEAKDSLFYSMNSQWADPNVNQAADCLMMLHFDNLGQDQNVHECSESLYEKISQNARSSMTKFYYSFHLN